MEQMFWGASAFDQDLVGASTTTAWRRSRTLLRVDVVWRQLGSAVSCGGSGPDDSTRTAVARALEPGGRRGPRPYHVGDWRGDGHAGVVLRIRLLRVPQRAPLPSTTTSARGIQPASRRCGRCSEARRSTNRSWLAGQQGQDGEDGSGVVLQRSIGAWETSLVTNMMDVFEFAAAFNQPIGD